MPDRNISQLDKALLGLRSLVVSADFADRQRLPEVAVAKQLGISRTPLRQAMDRLVAEGLLERISTGGCRVATLTKEDVTDAIELRGVIEGTAARLAAERGVAPDLLKDAAGTLDLIDDALNPDGDLDFDQYVKQNEHFHALLAQFPASALIAREVARINLLPFASPSAFFSNQALIPDFYESLKYAQRQHRAILEAIEKREGARAEGLVREHARLALTNLDYVIASEGVSRFAVPGLALVSSK